MNRERLEHTAREVLPFVEPENLAMSMWRCGTSACAFGHECLSDYGKAEGLQWHHYFVNMPTFKGNDEFAAVTSYYGIGKRDALWIFCPDKYKGNPTPAEVAARIESLLACEA